MDDLRAAVAPLPLSTKDTVLSRAGTVFDWTVAGGHRPDNPAKMLRATWRGLKKPAANHRKALPAAEAPDFFRRLRVLPGAGGAAGALALVVLTGLRSGEASGVRYEEIDRETRTLTIEGERMKDGRQHRVPLSDAAVAVLDAAGPRKGSGRVFSAPRGGPLADKALRTVMLELNAGATVHGHRATLRTWMEGRSVAWEVAEGILAHRVGSAVERAYARSDLLDRRRQALEIWAEYVEEGTG